ncbi:MAG: DUF2071 domain-containing protein [Chitinophagaceae bacterium]
MSKRTFLSAKWEYLAMFNYEIDPIVLAKHIPPGTEIDFFNGKALVSVVGFLFNSTKVMGIKWPWHINFEEANLRYYIKRFDNKQWKRGVGFVSEIVPKPLVSFMANLMFNEHYSNARMDHRVSKTEELLRVEYSWQKRNQYKNRLQVTASPLTQEINNNSEEEFIFEHYFGYNQLSDTTIIEYAVHHPRWETYAVKDYLLDCDIENLYGKDFVPFISGKKPHSVFLAKGSTITVDKPVRIKTSS